MRLYFKVWIALSFTQSLSSTLLPKQSNCLGKNAKFWEWHQEKLGKTSHSKHLRRISNSLDRICQFWEWHLTPKVMILHNRQFQNFATYLDKNSQLLEFLRRLRLAPRLPTPNCLNPYAWWLLLLLFWIDSCHLQTVGKIVNNQSWLVEMTINYSFSFVEESRGRNKM